MIIQHAISCDRIIRSALFCLTLLFFSYNSVSAQPLSGQGIVLDKVIAQVANETILLSDLTELENRLKQSGVDSNTADCYALESLVQEKLLVYGAEKNNVNVSDKEVNQELSVFLEEVLNNPANIYEIVELYGSVEVYKDKFRPVIKNQLLARRFKQQLTSDIEVTPAQVRLVYESIAPSQLPEIKEEVALELVVMADSNVLEKVKSKVLSGELSMEAASEKYSTDKISKISNGIVINPLTNELKLPWEELPPDIYFNSEQLKKGEVSQIFQYNDQWAITRIKEEFPRHTLSYEADYYKLQLGAIQEKRSRVLQDWFDKAMQEAYIHVDPSYKDCHIGGEEN